MTELKTKPNDLSVTEFLDGILEEKRRQDCYKVLKIMEEVTDAKPKMWGSSIVGFGDYRYKYASGREGDWFIVGFSPRKQNLTLYLMGGLLQQTDLLQQLGKYKMGKGCLYINKLEDINLEILRAMILKSNTAMKAGHFGE